MKAPFVRHYALLLGTTIVIAGNVFAQSPDMLGFQQAKYLNPEFGINIESNNSVADPEVSSKTLTAFVGMFKGASDARWYETDNKLLVRFNKDGRESTALFSKKGKHIYTISYGSEKHLPAEVRRIVKTNYFDFEISHVIEVNSLGKTAWVVKLEDQNRMITVNVVDDEIEETENFRKAK